MSKANPIPAHEPRNVRGLLHSEPPAQGGILAPGGPSSGSHDREPGEPIRKGTEPPAPRSRSSSSSPRKRKPRPKRKRPAASTSPAE